uniref:Uncharacterized protein n=1 Tax=viral metagenome TaxID=1070528 RepID=A0A6M3L602_9ZZZZ
MATFQLGETAICYLEIRDENGTLIESDLSKVGIYKGTILLVEGDMVKDSVGKYYYDYLTDTKGTLIAEFTATYNTRVTKTRESFKVT